MEQPPTPDPDPVPDGDRTPAARRAGRPIEHKLTELQRMAAMINRINAETACAPDGMYVTDAAGNYVAKPGFFVRYPDQLSSYVAPTGNLGKAAPGTWGLVWDSFKRVAAVRVVRVPGLLRVLLGQHEHDREPVLWQRPEERGGWVRVSLRRVARAGTRKRTCSFNHKQVFLDV